MQQVLRQVWETISPMVAVHLLVVVLLYLPRAATPSHQKLVSLIALPEGIIELNDQMRAGYQ